MRAPIPLGDVVGEAQHVLVVAVVPPQGELDLDLLAGAADHDGISDQWLLGLVQVAHEGLHAAVVGHDLLEGLGPAQVLEADGDARVQEGQLAQAVLQRLPVEFDLREGLQRRHEGDRRAGSEAVAELGRRSGDGQGRHRVAALEAHLVGLTDPPDLELQPVGQGVDHRHADAVQAAGDLVRVLVEFPAGMQLGHDDLGRRHALFVDVCGNAAPVVHHGDRAVGVQAHFDGRGVAGQGLVDGVVHHFVDHVVQARSIVGVADVHARSLAHGVQALEHLDGIGAVVGAVGDMRFVGHRSSVMASAPASTRTPWARPLRSANSASSMPVRKACRASASISSNRPARREAARRATVSSSNNIGFGADSARESSA